MSGKIREYGWIVNEATREIVVRLLRNARSTRDGTLVDAGDGTYLLRSRHAWIRVRRSVWPPFRRYATAYYLMRDGDPRPLALVGGKVAVAPDDTITDTLLQSAIRSRIADRVLRGGFDWRIAVILALIAISVIAVGALAFRGA